MAQPHPPVAAGAGLWMVPAVSTAAVVQWRAGLPDVVTTGDIPTQEALDTWTTERTANRPRPFEAPTNPRTEQPMRMCIGRRNLSPIISPREVNRLGVATNFVGGVGRSFRMARPRLVPGR
jgi:hypothetical protein